MVPVDAKIYTDTSFDAWGAPFGKFETADIKNKQMLKLHMNIFEHLGAKVKSLGSSKMILTLSILGL